MLSRFFCSVIVMNASLPHLISFYFSLSSVYRFYFYFSPCRILSSRSGHTSKRARIRNGQAAEEQDPHPRMVAKLSHIKTWPLMETNTILQQKTFTKTLLAVVAPETRSSSLDTLLFSRSIISPYYLASLLS